APAGRCHRGAGGVRAGRRARPAARVRGGGPDGGAGRGVRRGPAHRRAGHRGRRPQDLRRSARRTAGAHTVTWWETPYPRSVGLRGTVRAHRAMARTAFRSLVAYQTSFVFGLLATAMSALAMLYLWRAVLAAGERQGFDWPDMKAYLLVAFVAGSLVSSYVDYQMAGRIREGAVALDLVRPADYQRSRFAEAIGYAGYELGTALAVGAFAAVVFGGVRAPDPDTLALFVVSAVLVLPLRFGVVYMSGLVVFWTRNYIGVQAARIALVSLFSWSLVPLAFF